MRITLSCILLVLLVAVIYDTCEARRRRGDRGKDVSNSSKHEEHDSDESNSGRKGGKKNGKNNRRKWTKKGSRSSKSSSSSSSREEGQCPGLQETEGSSITIQVAAAITCNDGFLPDFTTGSRTRVVCYNYNTVFDGDIIDDCVVGGNGSPVPLPEPIPAPIDSSIDLVEVPDCSPELGEPINAVYSYTVTASIRCLDGYFLLGERSITCEDNDQWSGVLGTCEKSNPYNCPDLSAPDFGDVFTFLRAQLKCDPGFRPQGTSRLTCNGETGNWSGSMGTCIESDGGNSGGGGGSGGSGGGDAGNGPRVVSVPDCGLLDDVANGGIIYEAQANLVCARDYDVIGSSTIYCNEGSSFQWNGNLGTCAPLNP